MMVHVCSMHCIRHSAWLIWSCHVPLLLQALAKFMAEFQAKHS
jgi:hypothetical protein